MQLHGNELLLSLLLSIKDISIVTSNWCIMHDFTARQLILGKPLCRQGERFIRDILAGIQSNETQTLDSYT